MKEKIREILENNFRSEAIDKITELIVNYKEFEPVFNNGKWVEEVKEESLDELYKDYLNNMKFVRITDYIKENKEKFLIALNNL